MKKPIMLALLLFPALGASAMACNCGPDYCVDTPAYTAALNAKKAAATRMAHRRAWWHYMTSWTTAKRASV
jgi:hypothetical protein